MTPLCKVEVTLPGFWGPGGMRDLDGFDFAVQISPLLIVSLELRGEAKKPSLM